MDSQLLNLTDGVSTQAEVLAPQGQRCDNPTQWRSRRCIATQLDRAWVDKCRRPGEAHYYYMYGSCPRNKMCMNTLFRRTINGHSFLTRNIYCIGRPKTRQEKPALGIAVSAISGQVGIVPINTFDLGSLSPVISVDVSSTIRQVSIAALIEGTYTKCPTLSFFYLAIDCR